MSDKTKILRAWFYGRAYHLVFFPWTQTVCGLFVDDGRLYDPATAKGYKKRQTEGLPCCKKCSGGGDS